MNTQFKIHTFDNGTQTLMDQATLQTMHSKIGPLEEAQAIYIDPLNLSHMLQHRKSVTIWDVGMGMAVNILGLLHHLLKLQKQSCMPEPFRLIVYSFESKTTGLEFTIDHWDELEFTHKLDFPIKDLLKSLLTQQHLNLHWEKLSLEWTLIPGDFYPVLDRLALKDWDQHPHFAPAYLFYDFYDPKHFQNLWSFEAFLKLKQILQMLNCQDTQLLTYSCATPVRLALMLAGFYVGEGNCTEAKGATTIASLNPKLLKNPLGTRWIEKLKRSSHNKPYGYPYLSLSPEHENKIKRMLGESTHL